MAQVSQTSTGEVRFPSAKVIVNDWWLVTPDQNILLRDVLSTEIVTRCYKVNWRSYFLEETAIALSLIGFAIILEVIGLHSLARGFASGLLLWILIFALSRAWDLKGRSVEIAIVLNTRSGPVEVPGLKNGTHIELIAKEINKRLARWSGQTSTSRDLEPLRRTVRLATPPPDTLGPIKYKWARITIAKDEITLAGRTYHIDEVCRANIQNEGQPMQWDAWVRLLLVTLGVALVISLMPLFSGSLLVEVALLIVLSFGLIGLMVSAKEAIATWKRASVYVLIVETKSGHIRAYTTSNKLYLRMIAGNINRAVKDHAKKASGSKVLEEADQQRPTPEE